MKAASQILEHRSTVSGCDEDAFFAKLRLPNGTYKTTGHGRLHALDAWLAQRMPASAARLLDVAVSSGVTTVDLIETLRAHGHTPHVTACDLCITAYIRDAAPGLEVLLDSKGRVLQLSTPALVKGRPHDPQGSFARAMLAKAFRATEWFCGDGEGLPKKTDRPVQLISRKLLAQSDVEVAEHDLFEARPEWSGRFDVIRAANILNKDYFDDTQLLHLAHQLGGYLREGGRLLVARTDEANVTTASLFTRPTDGKFALVDRYGAGSLIESLLLSGRPGQA